MPIVQTTVPPAMTVAGVQVHIAVRDPHRARADSRTSMPRSRILRSVNLPERRRKLRKQTIAAVKKNDPQVLARNALVVPQARVEKIHELARRLHAAEAAADHDERQQPAAMFAVRLQLRLLEPRDDPVSQEQRIAERLQRQRVARHALDDVEVRVGAAGEHELVVATSCPSLRPR